MSEFANLPDRPILETLLVEAIAPAGGKVVSMELERRPTHVPSRKKPPFTLVVLVDAADGHGFTFNHGMPDLDLLKHDVAALAKVINQHLRERNGNPAATAGVQ